MLVNRFVCVCVCVCVCGFFVGAGRRRGGRQKTATTTKKTATTTTCGRWVNQRMQMSSSQWNGKQVRRVPRQGDVCVRVVVATFVTFRFFAEFVFFLFLFFLCACISLETTLWLLLQRRPRPVRRRMEKKKQTNKKRTQK